MWLMSCSSPLCIARLPGGQDDGQAMVVAMMAAVVVVVSVAVRKSVGQNLDHGWVLHRGQNSGQKMTKF